MVRRAAEREFMRSDIEMHGKASGEDHNHRLPSRPRRKPGWQDRVPSAGGPRHKRKKRVEAEIAKNNGEPEKFTEEGPGTRSCEKRLLDPTESIGARTGGDRPQRDHSGKHVNDLPDAVKLYVGKYKVLTLCLPIAPSRIHLTLRTCRKQMSTRKGSIAFLLSLFSKAFKFTRPESRVACTLKAAGSNRVRFRRAHCDTLPRRRGYAAERLF